MPTSLYKEKKSQKENVLVNNRFAIILSYLILKCEIIA